MAIPTAVNGQITDLVSQAHSAGGDAALCSIVELLKVIAHSLDDAQGGASSRPLKSGNSDEMSSAFTRAENELQEIRTRLASAK